MKQEIECPHCRKTFPIPTKRHYFSPSRGWGGGSGTLCGIPHRNMELIVKDGETVNCKVCIKRRENGKV
jgi:hypothetical protein